MQNIDNIRNALNAVQEAHSEYNELNTTYIRTMQSAHGYRLVKDDVQQVKSITGAVGYVHNATFYNERGALTAGLIEKIAPLNP